MTQIITFGSMNAKDVEIVPGMSRKYGWMFCAAIGTGQTQGPPPAAHPSARTEQRARIQYSCGATSGSRSHHDARDGLEHREHDGAGGDVGGKLGREGHERVPAGPCAMTIAR